MADLFLSASDLNTLKEMVEIDLAEDLYLNNNLLSFFSKKTPDGDPWKVPVRLTRTTAHGADDVGALAQLAGASSAGRPTFGAFVLPFAQTVATSKVPQAAIAASARKGGVVPLLVDAIRDARMTVAQDIEQALGGNGYGAIGQFTSHTGSGPYVLQMATLASVVNINVGDIVVSAAAYNSGSLDAGTAQITDVDRDAATITVAVVSGGWSPTDTHVLFLALDKLAGNIGTPSKPFGLDAYLPVDPAARVATFQGLVRATDPQNLSGCLVNASSTDIVSGVNRALAKLGPKKDASPKVAFMNDNMYAALQAQMFNKVRFSETEIEGSVNFEGIKFRTAKGELKAATSWSIPDNRIYLLSQDACEIGNMLGGEVVQSAANNGKDFVDSYDSFGATIRQWAYLQSVVKGPGNCAVISYT